MGDNYREVDLTANALINVGAIHESPALNSSTYSINSNSSTKTLYTFQSDEIGNITNISGVEINWNGRRLESIGIEGIEYLTYDYNIDGQRVKKNITDPETGTIITTEYFYNGDILAGQKTGNDTIVFMYDNNGDIFGFTYNGTPYYYVKNAQNDVFLILDENGYAQVLYQYDAWGNVTDCIDATDFGLATINPILYRSYYVDLELGIYVYYLNSRYYAPIICRFISGDSVLGVTGDINAYNIFAYCSNNPVNRIDITGQSWSDVKSWFSEKWSNFKNWAKNTFGVSTQINQEKAISTEYYFFATNEVGTGYNKEIDNGKHINGFSTTNIGSRRLSDSSIGVDVNINGYGAGVQVGSDTGVFVHLKENSFEISYNDLGKVSFKNTYMTENGTYAYNKITLNGPEIILTAVVLIYVPELLPVAVGVAGAGALA